jgi:hypothetical protein
MAVLRIGVQLRVRMMRDVHFERRLNATSAE